MTMPWNDGSAFQFYAPSKMPRNPRKQTTGKIRTRWSDRNRFNPIKMRRPSTLDTKVSELDKIDIKAPILTTALTNSVCHALIVSRVLCILHLKSQIGPVRIGIVPRLRQGKRLIH